MTAFPYPHCFVNCMMQKKKWFRERNYHHFDDPVGENKARSIVENPRKVSSHSFFPFIKSEIIQRRYIKKERRVKEKRREIAYASHMDSHIFSYYTKKLNSKYEEYIRKLPINDSVIAYRRFNPPKCNIDFAYDVFQYTSKSPKCLAIALDVKGFFDNLDHKILKEKWCEVLNKERLPNDHYAVYKAITSFSFVKREDIEREFPKSLKYGKRSRICSIEDFRTKIRGKNLIEKNNKLKGIPQGSPISATLSNVYMLDFDKSILEYVRSWKGIYRRYSDDIILVFEFDENTTDQYIEKFAEKAQAFVERELKRNRLALSKDKTMISLFKKPSPNSEYCTADKPLQYLGFIFDGSRIMIRSRTISRFVRKMKRFVKWAKKAGEEKGNKKAYRRTIYRRFSHIGNRNYLSYAKLALIKTNSKSIKKQNKRYWTLLRNLLSD